MTRPAMLAIPQPKRPKPRTSTQQDATLQKLFDVSPNATKHDKACIALELGLYVPHSQIQFGDAVTSDNVLPQSNTGPSPKSTLGSHTPVPPNYILVILTSIRRQQQPYRRLHRRCTLYLCHRERRPPNHHAPRPLRPHWRANLA